jgi:hypothetical protein
VRRFIGPFAVALIAVLGLAVALVQRPGDRALATDVFLLFVGALALGVLLRETGKDDRPLPGPSPIELALRERPTREERIPELERVERTVGLATQTVFDVHYRLRPLLREVARNRLAPRGVELDAPDGAAEALLGPDAWALVRPDLPRPRHHFERGIELEALTRAVDALERL